MSVYKPENFIGRVNHAAAVISRKGEATRHFDTCFEMWDGDAVVAAVYRRSLKNPKIAANLPRYLTPESVREASERYAGQNLGDVAAQLRAAAEERYKTASATELAITKGI